MNSDKFNAAISAGKPYFGEEVLGTHGNPERQRHMTDLVRFVCSECNHQPIKILEIGSWIGVSAITWSNAIRLFNDRSGQVFCVDPWEPYLFNQETPSGWDLHMDNLLTNDFAYQLFNHNIQCSGNNSLIQAFRGLSSSIVPNFPDDTFDIIFIDGRSRIKCLINSLDLIKKNGVIIFDDSNRKEYKKAIHNFPLKRKTFAGLCPTLPYISETTFFFN